jgi:aspartyl-tRNA(Asn)/glutamyl-tRNA(Gln) amidotransferase subunit C
MSIDFKTVDHVAVLARLALSDEERQKLRDQLSTILEHINAIGEADTSQVPATANVLPLADVMRPDDPHPFEDTQGLVDRAPAHEGPYIRVRAVLDNE